MLYLLYKRVTFSTPCLSVTLAKLMQSMLYATRKCVTRDADFELSWVTIPDIKTVSSNSARNREFKNNNF
ncbi:hypothetical protein DPMN_127129 [Dreissena polymorpha]|uniref:Uncharacterized protein n=1 Tax=Dreissena polymorpha TaxID=45954 RepID=A0A9D4H0R3_DREPO|nr:hypothetical protein DPMN_127129 [Dreissena polymorpha]